MPNSSSPHILHSVVKNEHSGGYPILIPLELLLYFLCIKLYQTFIHQEVSNFLKKTVDIRFFQKTPTFQKTSEVHSESCHQQKHPVWPTWFSPVVRTRVGFGSGTPGAVVMDNPWFTSLGAGQSSTSQAGRAVLAGRIKWLSKSHQLCLMIGTYWNQYDWNWLDIIFTNSIDVKLRWTNDTIDKRLLIITIEDLWNLFWCC